MAEILLGVTGGAAAFKSVILASMFKKAGHRVNTVMTAAACEFISPLQLTSVTGGGCYTELFSHEPPGFIPHISLTDNADLMVIAPATAHFMARAALGLGDDLLSSAFLACASPVVMAPGMNTRMWNNAAVEENAGILVKRGIIMAGPVEGVLACGTTGWGRMMEPADIFDICSAVLTGRGSE
jgi:phosphopantothenoylcysteine decarboxylase/phosphopantothenate--cysteine ligase